jgi:hypothetical protein
MEMFALGEASDTYVSPLTVGGALTTGNITINDNTAGHWYQGYPWYWQTSPLLCSDNCHVFGCEHAEKCQCGKAKRKIEPKCCPTCGKKDK